MSELGGWQRFPTGGIVDPARAPRLETGGWRTGVKPVVHFSACVNCLLCWVYCPDSACQVDAAGRFIGVDESVCKGCELCAAVCPVNAIEMVAE